VAYHAFDAPGTVRDGEAPQSGEHMTDDFGVDLDEVLRVIDAADVLIVRFQIIQKRFLIDFRTKPGVGPLLAMVPRAESAEDRFRSIKRMRPEFPYPERVMSFHWPRTIPVLEVSGVWQHLVDRVMSLAGADGADEMRRAMAELLQEERREVLSAINGGDHYQTLWDRRTG